MKKKIKWINCLLSLDVVLGVACLLVLFVVTFLGAMMRYFFNSPFVWQEEVQVWMITWAIFAGGSYAFRCGSHVSIEVLVETFSPKAQKIIEWFGYLYTLAVLVFVFYYSCKLNIQYMDLPHKIALRDIQAGEDVIKYGVFIGYATQFIRAGEHVHVHNLDSEKMMK